MAINLTGVGTAYTRMVITGPEKMVSQANYLWMALDNGTAEMGWTMEMLQFGTPTRYVTTLADPTNTFTYSPAYDNYLLNGTPIFFTLINTTTGILTYTTYYIVNSTTTTFQVEAVLGSGTPVTLTDAGSAHYARGRASITGTTDVTGDKIVSIAHGLVAGDPVYVVLAPNAGAVPIINSMYYVVNDNPDDFQISVDGITPANLDGTDGNVRYYGLSTPPFGVAVFSNLFTGCTDATKYAMFMFLPNMTSSTSNYNSSCNFDTDAGHIRLRAGAKATATGLKWGMATTDPTTNTFTNNGHGLAVGDRITFYELTNISDNYIYAGREYWVATSSLNTFTVSNAFDTTPIDFSGSAGIARYVSLANSTYDYDDNTSYYDYEAQPFSSVYDGTMNIYATNQWCTVFCSVAQPAPPRYGGRTNKYWCGVFEIMRENPNDGLPDATGQLPFGYIAGARPSGLSSLQPISLCRNYWGNVHMDASNYVLMATTYGRCGNGANYSGTTGNAVGGPLSPVGQKPAGLSSETGWALDIFVWEQGPQLTPGLEVICLGRIYGLKAATLMQGSVGSTAIVKVDSDYMYDSTGVSLTHQILTTFSTSYVSARWLLPQDLYPTP